MASLPDAVSVPHDRWPTPEEHLIRQSLRTDAPMVAPSYSESRSAMAKKVGLGREEGGNGPHGEPTATKAGSARGAVEADVCRDLFQGTPYGYG